MRCLSGKPITGIKPTETVEVEKDSWTIQNNMDKKGDLLFMLFFFSDIFSKKNSFYLQKKINERILNDIMSYDIVSFMCFVVNKGVRTCRKKHFSI